jgi:hypothetical protein
LISDANSDDYSADIYCLVRASGMDPAEIRHIHLTQEECLSVDGER